MFRLSLWLRRNSTDSLLSASQSVSQSVGLQSLWRHVFEPEDKKPLVEADMLTSHHITTSPQTGHIQLDNDDKPR